MALSVHFELEDDDLEHFRDLMSDVCARTDCQAKDSIVSEADAMVARLRDSDAPHYVRTRLDTLSTLITMIRDDEWQLPEQEGNRVSYALAYFTDPGGLIPDNTPGLGYLDDAIMIELVAQELSHEISAYQDFCSFRESESARRSAGGQGQSAVTRSDWLDAKRAELQRRMRQESRSFRTLFSLFS